MSEKLENMFSPGWYRQLKPFLQSPAFNNIGKSLQYESKQLKEITPPFDLTFRAFKECEWHQLHTVIIGMDPYPGKIDKKNYVADGLAFSSRLSQKAPKSLSLIFSAIEDSFYQIAGYGVQNYDLTRWANQGILLLNCALSFPLGEKSGAHIQLWQPFIHYVLRVINERKDGMVFGLMGSNAKKLRPLLTNETFAIYECDHPASAVYRGGKWDDDHIFTKMDGYLKFRNNIHTRW